ncbi:MAG TPA: signal peptidase I [Caulobacteraceae bacterium]|nr:signal peptidase I [Caulobacteraceae bacterium]
MTADAKSARAAPKAGLVHEMVEIVKTIVYALLIALVLKVIVFQPYTIPSASEEPNLYEGDYIIVSKWSYGWSRHSIPFSPPIFSGRVLFRQPQRGDIVVFKLPRDGRTDYIKRLVGLPGDTIQLKGGQVYINGKALPRLPMADATGDLPDGNDLPVLRFDEQMPNGRQHVIQKAPTGSQADNTGVYVVPPHCYFMLGDNRDNSLDSRFDPAMPADAGGLASCAWDPSLDQYLPPESGVGFVPEEDLVGKAQFILASWKPGASLLKPWTWIAIRSDRFFHALK